MTVALVTLAIALAGAGTTAIVLAVRGASRDAALAKARDHGINLTAQLVDAATARREETARLLAVIADRDATIAKQREQLHEAARRDPALAHLRFLGVLRDEAGSSPAEPDPLPAPPAPDDVVHVEGPRPRRPR